MKGECSDTTEDFFNSASEMHWYAVKERNKAGSAKDQMLQ